jgi:hypothetical protein
MNDRQKEKLNATAVSGATVSREVSVYEAAKAEGRYTVECIGADGYFRWREVIDNLVVTVGKNLALDSYLAGSAYTVVGPYMFLVSGNPASVQLSDTMASKTGWAEVGNANGPQFNFPNAGGSNVRGTCAWSSATGGGKSLSAALSFYMTGLTGGATVAGCGICFGSGAVNTIDSTAGVLYSVGAFVGGSRTVSIGDTLNVSYTASL